MGKSHNPITATEIDGIEVSRAAALEAVKAGQAVSNLVRDTAVEYAKAGGRTEVTADDIRAVTESLMADVPGFERAMEETNQATALVQDALERRKAKTGPRSGTAGRVREEPLDHDLYPEGSRADQQRRDEDDLFPEGRRGRGPVR